MAWKIPQLPAQVSGTRKARCFKPTVLIYIEPYWIYYTVLELALTDKEDFFKYQVSKTVIEVKQ